MAMGLIYMAMGFVSARVAFLGARNREEGVPGALRFLLDQRYGAILLGAVLLGLAGIAVAHAAEAIRTRRGPLARIGLLASAIGYAILVWTSARLLFHLGRGGASHAGISWLLRATWGATVLEIVGAAVIVGGLWEVYLGVFGPLNFSRKLLHAGLARCLAFVARFGLLARGLVLCVLGFFLIRAAEELDPNRVRSLGGALSAFSHTMLGPGFMGVVALGMGAYGVHLWTRALLKRRV